MVGTKAAPLRPRTATLRTLHHPLTREVLDRSVVLTFPAPHSFTGEDVVELHVHGGKAVVGSILHALGQLPHMRMAEPGEFTKRAFLNSKLDLTQVEALADLVRAETEWQRRQALQQMRGDLGAALEQWRMRILRSLASVEAVLDFGESDEIDDGVLEQVYTQTRDLAATIRQHLQRRHGELIRSGIRAVILGPPNAGKSSLLNILAQRQAAIVSPIAAGLRHETSDLIEREGIRRARERIQASDLRLCILDIGEALQLPADVEEHIDVATTVVILNKSDTMPTCEVERRVQSVRQLLPSGIQIVAISCTSGSNLAELVSGIGQMLQRRFSEGAEGESVNHLGLAVTQERHRLHLTECAEALERVIADDSRQADLVLVGEELRQAMQCIGRITGRVDVEEVLDVVFRDFCIGK